MFDAVVTSGIEVGDGLEQERRATNLGRRRCRRRGRSGAWRGGRGSRRIHRDQRRGPRDGGRSLGVGRGIGLGFRRLLDDQCDADQRCGCGQQDADWRQPVPFGLPYRPAIGAFAVGCRQLVHDRTQREQHRRDIGPGIGRADGPRQHWCDDIGHNVIELPSPIRPALGRSSGEEPVREHSDRRQVGSPCGGNRDGVVARRTVENDPSHFGSPPDVVGVDTSVSEARAVQDRQRLGDRDDDADCLGRSESPGVGTRRGDLVDEHPRGQLLGDDREMVRVVVGVEDVEQAVVLHPRECLGLQAQPMTDLAVSRRPADGDGPIERAIQTGPRLDGTWLQQLVPLVPVVRDCAGVVCAAHSCGGAAKGFTYPRSCVT